MKKVYIPTLLCVLSIIHLTTAQIPFNLQISFEKDTLDLISPWAFRLEVLNTSDSDIFVYPLRVTGGGMVHYGEISIYVKNENDTIWNRTKIIENRFDELGKDGSPYLKLQANKKIESHFFCRPPLEEIKPGKLEVRATCISQYGRAVSESDTLYINKYKDDDLLVFQYLSKLKRPDFILYPVLPAARTDSSYIRHGEYIVSNFSNSKLITYTHLYLATWYYYKADIAANVSVNKDEMLKYLRLTKKHGLIAFEKGDSRTKEKAIFLLKSSKRPLLDFYYQRPPIELEEEFTFSY